MSIEEQNKLDNLEQNENVESKAEQTEEFSFADGSDVKSEDSNNQESTSQVSEENVPENQDNANETESVVPEKKIEENEVEEKSVENEDKNEQEIKENVAEKEQPQDEEKQEAVPEKKEEIKEDTKEEVKEDTKEEVKEETTEDSKDKAEVEEKPKVMEKTPRQKYFDKIFAELKEKMEKDEVIEVEVKSRIRGGLRVHYKDIPLFLPTSHFSVKRNPSEEELSAAIDKVIKVQVHEYQEFDEGRKAVIVSRRKLALQEVWDSIKVGDIIEGKVTSVPSFGVFVEFNGVEGLIHVSRLSRMHVKDPKDLFKKGDKIKAKIIDIDKENNKIALSRKEVEDNFWKGVESEFPAGSRVKGVVKRLADFGAYVELKPGVEGLLRNNELSWTRRYKRPSEILKEGQEIEVEIISISEEQERAQLSYKRTLPNPWQEIKEKYTIGSEYEASVIQVIPQGAIIHINEELDGFMPRSKMRPVMKGKKIPYKSGDKLTVIISDINPDEESLILEPKVDENTMQSETEHNSRRQNSNKKNQNKSKSSGVSNGFSIGDFLSDSDVNKLKNIND